MLRHAGFDVSGQAAGGAFLSSASVTRSHCRQPAEQCGWMASCIASGSHWAGVPDITWQTAWQSRSVDTLLRTVRRRAARPRDPLRAVGIDDWAWRKGCQYGTVICDLERRRIVALLPDRAGGTGAAWLRDHPSIEFIARDRGASYGDAASKGAPQAVQIADRWHLFKNASASFLDVVRQNMHAIRKSSATDEIDPALLSCTERKRWDNFQHRKKTVDAVLRLLEQGTPLKQITRRLSLARQTRSEEH